MANGAPLSRQRLTVGVLWQNPGRVVLQDSVPTNGHNSGQRPHPHPHSIQLVSERSAADVPWAFAKDCASVSGPCW